MTAERWGEGGAPYRARPVARRGKGLLLGAQLVIAAALVVAVGWGLWAAANSVDQGERTAAAVIPEQIAGLRLVQAVTGADAVQAVRRLHSLDVGIVDAWIGQYENEATVWVGVAPDAAGAADLMTRMTEAMANGNSPFTHRGQQEVGGIAVHRVSGGDQVHFYYQRGNQVIWVAAPPGDDGLFLRQAIQRIP